MEEDQTPISTTRMDGKPAWVIPALITLAIIAVLAFVYFAVIKKPATTTQTATQTAASSAPAPAQNAEIPTNNIYKTTSGAKGTYLTDFEGKTLYTFDKDTAGKSTCYDACVQKWPVYTSGATAQKTFPSGITTVQRTDGTLQFAYKGMPLYYYASDTKAGDTTGDGVGGVWHIVKP